jgi:hypothetical protein
MARNKNQKQGVSDTPEQPAVDIQNDEHRGVGGSYIFDPVTGKRTRVAGPDLDQPAAGQVAQPESAESTDPEVMNNESH